jgi:hypothetical protein
LLADQPFEGRDPRFALLKKVGRGSILIEGAGLVSFDPDTDQIAREIVALLQTVERFASQKLLRDLALKFDAVGYLTMSFRPSKAQPAGQMLSPPLSAHRGPLQGWVSPTGHGGWGNGAGA